MKRIHFKKTKLNSLKGNNLPDGLLGFYT